MNFYLSDGYFLFCNGEKRNGHSSANGNTPAALLPVKFALFEEFTYESVVTADVLVITVKSMF